MSAKRFVRDAGEYRIVTEADAELEPVVEDVLGLVQDAVSQHGRGKQIGVQFGWTRFTVTPAPGSTELIVQEPDFSTDPFSGVRRDISCSLRVMADQVRLLQTLELEGEPCLYSDTLIVAKGALEAPEVYLQRNEGTDPGDSGWYIGTVGEDQDELGPEDLEALPTCELLGTRPHLLKALLLPTGYLVVFKGDRLEAILDPEDEPVWPRR